MAEQHETQLYPTALEGGRFELRRLIGEGAHGRVHVAFDAERSREVALKIVAGHERTVKSTLRNEFRSLSDISHPNLVALDEFFVVGAAWFFTMEIVDGVDFVEWVREALARPGSEAAVRHAIGGLANGLRTLHRAGIVHRDIKPANVLVEPGGRVVLLDFGLAATLDSVEAEVAGTHEFMAPEQRRGGAQAPSDWYAVGAMLRLALPPETETESLSAIEPTASTTRRRAGRRRMLAVDATIEDLVRALLRDDPAERPTADEVLAWAGVTPIEAALRRPAHHALFGREAQLSLLQSAFDMSRSHAVLVRLGGESGVGKSCLINHFVTEAARRGCTVVRGCCHLREWVPYRALDDIAQALVSQVAVLRPQERASIGPGSVARLRLLLPQVDLADLGCDPTQSADELRVELTQQSTIDLRRGAVLVLRRLLETLSLRRELIVWIDDMHLADDDSAALLAELIHTRPSPGVLWLLSYRPLLEKHRRNLGALLSQSSSWPSSDATVIDVAVEPLDDETATQLAMASGVTRDDARALASIARGRPFLLTELATRFAERRAMGLEQHASELLRESVDERLEAAGQRARRLMEVIAVARRPLPLSVALNAARAASGDRSALVRLRNARLVQISGYADTDTVQAYHESLADIVRDGLDAERRIEVKKRIAHAIEEHGQGDAVDLAELLEVSGERATAARLYAQSARAAMDVEAYARAAERFGRAADLGDGPGRASLIEQMATAHAMAGNSTLAAEAFERAALEGEPGLRGRRLRLAAQHFGAAGDTSRAVRIIEGEIRRLDVAIPRTAIGRRMAIVAGATALRRGLLRVRTVEIDVSGFDRERSDTRVAAASIYSMIDPVASTSFWFADLLANAAGGRPENFARAYASAAYATVRTGRLSPRERGSIARRVRALLDPNSTPHTRVLGAMVAGSCAIVEGRWHDAASELEAATRGVATIAFPIDALMAELTMVGAYGFWGHFEQMHDAMRRLVANSDETTSVDLRVRPVLGALAHYWIANDNADFVISRAHSALDASPASRHRNIDDVTLGALSTALVYRGDHAQALQVALRRQRGQKAGGFGRHLLFRVDSAYRLAVAALAHAATGASGRKSLLEQARAAAKVLEADRSVGWVGGLADMVAAGLSAVRGDLVDATARLDSALDLLERSTMEAHAAAAQLRLAELMRLRGHASSSEHDAAAERLSSLGVMNIEAFVRAIAPPVRYSG